MNLLRTILLPFSYLYGGIMQFRNYLYDREIRRSFRFETCVISVGNLSVGGAGKTPMTEYLIRLLTPNKRVVTLSRGYKRKTTGFIHATESDSARTIGDEPYQYFKKFPDIDVTVGEERAVAIPFILAELPQTDVILLDDAFQHRTVLPDFQILVTEFHRPFYEDVLVPAGRLREFRKGAARADAIVITKCPENLTSEVIASLKKRVHEYAPGTPVFMSSISYREPVRVSGPEEKMENILLVTGIANPYPLATYLTGNYDRLDHMTFPDHHNFRGGDIRKIERAYESLGSNSAVLTTEKDMVRLLSMPDPFPENIPLYYVPIEVRFLLDGDKFDELILEVVESERS